MSKNNIIQVHFFGQEIGKLGYDLDKNAAYFQYNPQFLSKEIYTNIFPYLIKRIKPVQVFHQFSNETFRGLPPMIADSLPDAFGNIIFKEWFEKKHKNLQKITPLEQLTYVANRGMGALEYRPVAEVPASATINITEIVEVLEQVLNLKRNVSENQLNHLALLNVFKIGTSAGGARPKILISEHKISKNIIPGDLVYGKEYNHYLVKLNLDENEAISYNKAQIEFIYYQMAKAVGIEMMTSKLIDNQHFATLRYDRQNGEKQHVLTASGLTGWSFKQPENSTYENLFKLALGLKVQHKDIQQLYRRMVFNVFFANTDDHLKNHSFMYEKQKNKWELAPAYDLTYPLNINLNFSKISRALAINGKRTAIEIADLLTLAEEFSVKNPKKIIAEVLTAIDVWRAKTKELEIPTKIIKTIEKEFALL